MANNNVLAQIDEQVKKNKIVVYMKGTPSFPMCGFSAATVQVLDSYNVPYESVNVLEDPVDVVRDEMRILEEGEDADIGHNAQRQPHSLLRPIRRGNQDPRDIIHQNRDGQNEDVVGNERHVKVGAEH